MDSTSDNETFDQASDTATDKLYCIIVTPGEGPMDEQLAEALREYREKFARDLQRWENNPEKKQRALAGLGRVLAEWQEENGAFTEEEMARARALKSGVDTRS